MVLGIVTLDTLSRQKQQFLTEGLCKLEARLQMTKFRLIMLLPLIVVVIRAVRSGKQIALVKASLLFLVLGYLSLIWIIN